MRGYIYFLQPTSNNDGNKGIKIGCTKNFEHRLKSAEYKNCVVIQVNYVSDYHEAERDLKDEFKKVFPLLKGSETFIVEDITEGLNIFNSVVKKYSINHEVLQEEHTIVAKDMKEKAITKFNETKGCKEDTKEEKEETKETKETKEEKEETKEETKEQTKEETKEKEEKEETKEKPELKDFDKNDIDIEFNDGKIKFIYEGKTYCKPRSLKDERFDFFSPDGFRIHDDKLYIHKPQRKHGWYYVGPQKNSNLINQILANPTIGIRIVRVGTKDKNNIYIVDTH